MIGRISVLRRASEKLFILYDFVNNVIFLLKMKQNLGIFAEVVDLDELKEKYGIDSSALESIIQNPIFDKCLGSLFGSMIGDALGSYCENESKVSEEKMKLLMSMPGGGVHKTFAGQITDDSEMSLSLLSSLLLYDPQMPLKEQIGGLTILIAYSYMIWKKTQPFDSTQTINTGVDALRFHLDEKTDNPDMVEGINEAFMQINIHTKNSESNSSLMRLVPLAIFKSLIRKYRQKDLSMVDELIMHQIKLTHSNSNCIRLGIEWVDLLSKLISRQNRLDDISPIYSKYIEENTFKDWKQQSKEEKVSLQTTKNQNWIKIPYVHSLNKLKEISQNCQLEEELSSTLFKKTIRQMIQLGGDTDTNACILGGLLGSIVGFSELPKEYVQKMMKISMKKQESKTKRPAYFEPKMGFVNLIKLFLKFLRLN